MDKAAKELLNVWSRRHKRSCVHHRKWHVFDRKVL